MEWPIPSALSVANYQKLLRSSRQIATQLGIVASSSSNNNNKNNNNAHSTSSGNGGNGSSGGGGDGNNNTQAASNEESETGTATAAAAAESQQSYYGLTGFMNRVLNSSGTPSEKLDYDLQNNTDAEAAAARGSRPLRPPRHRCVATANGWIVAALECPAPNGPTLRLVSRWNVRRGSSADQWMALPPPISGDGRIVHVFVDPTGCHTLLSARNGEAYYIHSSLRLPQKLPGFGKNADGSLPKELTSISATSIVARRGHDETRVVQKGLTAGSWITAVAWDRERGTEGSTKRILLGTNVGEIYEYALISPNSEDQEEALEQPILLHQLQTSDGDQKETVAPVTGIHAERLRTGVLVMASTSGRHTRTRLHTFYSPHNSSFRMVMADQQNSSLIELPGSVDFADLCFCNEHFALRTATGIYYGTIDRSHSGPAGLSGGNSMVIDSGILPYEDDKGSNLAVSLSLTPHHFIALGENNEVKFINRVSQRAIQKERIDSVTQSTYSNVDENYMGCGELLMDTRRPDQVWLRKARSLIHISSSQEDRDVWKFTLSKCLEMQPKSVTIAPPTSLSRSLVGAVPALSEEERNQEALFDQAKNLCANAAQKAVVTAVRAEYHLSQGRSELAAKYLAQCPPVLEPFADTAIRLALPMLGIDDPQGYGQSDVAKACLSSSNIPLITYLGDKMRVGKMNDDKMTCTMIGAWLTELYLNERGISNGSTTKSRDLESSERAMLGQFLTNHVNNTDAKSIMKILSSHDVSAIECAAYAARSGDIAAAVNTALCISSTDTTQAEEALRILDDAPFPLAESLYYKYASLLLARAPDFAGNSFLIRYKTHGLSPTRLLPSIMHYERMRTERSRKRTTDDADKIKFDARRGEGDNSLRPTSSLIDDPLVSMKYLEGVIREGHKSSAVYSYLISLYAKIEDEEPLFRFLAEQMPVTSTFADLAKNVVNAGGSFSDAEFSSPLDLWFALRTVLGTGRHFRSAIKLYMGFGMRQQAVELALKVDPVLAREIAQNSVELEERRRLWLMIAKDAASNTSNRGGKDVVSKVVLVLRDCGPDVLSIEDVLPFLPDFAQIDQIKDEICEALTSYSSKIDTFLKEMNDCDQICDSLRSEIERLRTHRMLVNADARCALSNKPVLTTGEPFYVFPSGYVFLTSALQEEVMRYLNEDQRRRVQEIFGEMKQAEQNRNNAATSSSKLQAELDGLIAAECPLTGSIMVDSIDRDFEHCEEFDCAYDNPYQQFKSGKREKIERIATV